ncbi:coiled-coil domain-containing protein 151 isoform X1 [Takifugu rubripes]|uniref:coiled-coil domain-containing protein 151 isoform X1 n=1 Tax=Takifugu rubripes TaxID=31033 RepID=UPI001145EE99|nr:coiled-coil domain-containing protein 151 isoform X1 [Takifugu rubripes]
MHSFALHCAQFNTSIILFVKCVQDALMIQDQKVLSKMKRLNAQKHVTQTKQQQLAELEREYQRMNAKAGGGAQAADAHARKKEEDAMMLRAQENRLEKIQFKCKEAENITVNYQRVKRHLQEESLTFQSILDSLEAEILKYREELNKMQIMNNEAQLSKKAVKSELQGHQELLSKERKEREHIISDYKKKTEKHKAPAEKVEGKKTGMMMMMVMQPDDMISEALQSEPIVERKEALSTFEDAYRCIKEATGVTNAQEILERFTVQKETHQHLLKLKEDNKKMLQQLREQKELLTKELEDVKYSGEAQVSSDLEVEWKQRLQAQQQRHDASKQHLNQMQKSLSTVRAGVEHLAARLHHIELTEEGTPEASTDPDEAALAQLMQFELKLQQLKRELQGQELDALLKEMEEEKFYVRIEEKLPAHNTRIKLPELRMRDDRYQEAEEGDVLTREELKHQSQLIVESKSKKKPWKNEKF